MVKYILNSFGGNENFNEVDFKVPLSGSKLFDMNAYVTAKKLCNKFPGLSFNMETDYIHIFGKLNDYWHEKFNEAVFKLGEIDTETEGK